MNLLSTTLLTLFTTFSALPTITRGPLGKTTNLTGYTYSTAATNFYRASQNNTILPASVVLDFEEDSTAYDLNNFRLTANTPFRSNFSGIELSLVNTTGSYLTQRYSHLIDFTFNTFSGGPNLQLTNTFYNNGTLTTTTINTPYNDLSNFHTFVIEYKYNTQDTGSDTIIRWGNTVITISTPFTSNVFWNADVASTTHNHAFRILGAGTSRSVSSWTSTSELTDFKFVDFASLEDSYYTDLATWYYEKGSRDADSSALIMLFSATIGILVNFFLMIVNLQVFDISISSLFAIIVIFVGFIWALKLIRG